jgi:hypothetical protein
MDVLDQFGGTEHLGLGFDTTPNECASFQGNQGSLVPEVGLEPT